jgi:CRISPR-associated protein Csd1
MMLTRLVEYAEREVLGDLDFQSRQADYELRIDASGKFVGLVPLTIDNKRQLLSGLPLGPKSKNNPGNPSFLVDNAQYVLGTAKKNSKEGNAKKCFDSYANLIRTAARESNDEALTALAVFLADEEERRKADKELADREAKRTSKPDTAEKNVGKRGDSVLVPVLDSDGATRMHERKNVIDWWKKRRDAERAAAAAGPLGRCLVTGKLTPIAATHDPIVGRPFPGTGAKLVSFDKDAFGSMGLDQGENAPVSEEAQRKYTSAINGLLEWDHAGKRRKSAIDLDNSVVIFWTKDPSDTADYVLDVLNPLPDSADAVGAGMGVWKGRQSKTFSATPFFACTLAANAGRVVVCDWFETTAAAVKESLDRWFDDLQIGAAEPEPVPLPALLKALEAAPGARNDKRGLPPGLATTLFRAAVLGGRLPISLLAAAVTRMRVPPKEKQRQDVLRLRVAIVKAVLRRTYERKAINVALDENNTDPPYLLGRLFAVLERLQGVAQGDINATIRDRYYGSASANPAAVFPRLLRLSAHHESKLRSDKRGLSIWFDRLKAEIVSKLPAEPLPATLDLQSQGLFAIGYYHQREYKKRDDLERLGADSEPAAS